MRIGDEDRRDFLRGALTFPPLHLGVEKMHLGDGSVLVDGDVDTRNLDLARRVEIGYKTIIVRSAGAPKVSDLAPRVSPRGQTDAGMSHASAGSEITAATCSIIGLSPFDVAMCFGSTGVSGSK